MAIGSSIGRQLLGASVIAVIGGVALGAAADDSVDKEGKLEEIVVTAQKREERLQDVPISAEAFAGQTLTQQNLNSLADIAQVDPSVYIQTVGLSDQLVIRGIGSYGSNQSYDQSVGTFIDDIYHGRSRTSAATFLDLDHVEILKGPQSTFFGNNAIAGAFNIVTNKPTDQWEGSTRLLYGQFDQYAAEAAAGGPITDTLGIRVAVTANGEDGWLKDINSGSYQPQEHNLAGRVTLRFKPNEDLDATLKVEGAENRSNGLWFQLDNCPPPAPFVSAGFCKAALGLGVPIGLKGDSTSGSPGQLTRLDTSEDVLTINYRQWDHTFTSVSGYYRYHYNLDFDLAQLPINQINAQVPEDYRQYSQEFRITSPTGQPIEYLAGVYFQTDSLFYSTQQSYFFLTPVIVGIPTFAPLVPYLPIGQDLSSTQSEHVYSVFGSATWNTTDRLKISAGLRGSQVDKTFDWNLSYGTATQSFGGLVALPSAVAAYPGFLGLGAPGSIDGLSRSDHAWMPSAKIQYQIDAPTMAYFSYANGFKAGGFNGTDTSGVAANLPFAPEHVNAYEVGLKSEPMNRRLLVDLAVFRMDYNDLQVSESILTGAGTYTSLVKNAAAARSQGVEFETQWAVIDNLRLSVAGTYLDARYISFPSTAPTILQSYEGIKVQSLSGQPTPYAPKWSGNVAGSYSIPLPGDYRLTTELSGYFSSNYFKDILDQWTGQYARLDGRLTLESPDRRWSLDLIGKNLNNQTIPIWYLGWPLSSGSLLLQNQAPRNVALQLRYKW